MSQMKICSWNVAHLDRLVEPNLNSTKLKRRNAIAQEVKRINPDIFCLVVGPKGEARSGLP